MDETLPKEAVKEFVLQRLRLAPGTLGKTKGDVLSIVRAIGGLQYGGHKIELFNRFENFKPEWYDYWCEKHALIEGHVLRGALRIVNIEDYPYYFKATRSVARRRKYHNCPLSLSDNHLVALDFIRENGPFTPSEFKKSFSAKYTQHKDIVGKLFFNLYNYGKIARMGRRNQKPLYHATEKLPHKLDTSGIGDREAKEWLFLKCLSIYGPFTLKDVAHWTGWSLIETKETLNALSQKKKVVTAKIEEERDIHYVRVEDLSLLGSLKNNLPEYSFVRILFNDDALLLGYYRRLGDFFGYHWKYPQFSEGIVWRAAILFGRQLIGEAIVDMPAHSRIFKVRKLLLRKELVASNVLSDIESEFARHSSFQNRSFSMNSLRLV